MPPDDADSRPEPAPILLRVAGLSADVCDDFACPRLEELGAQRGECEETLRELRERLVDRLYEAIGGAAAERRHFLLTVKRDAFNARPLTPHRDHPRWTDVEDAAGDLAERILSLEARLTDLHRLVDSTFLEERNRQRRRLLSFLDHRDFLRGIALGSPSLVENADRLRKTPPDDYGRKERSLETSLLRYVSRAALKVSPYSTLTRVGLATVDSDPGLDGLDLGPGPWRERSLARLKRYAPEQLQDVLLTVRPFLEPISVALNDTALELEPGSCRFLRPGRFKLDEDEGRLRFERETLVTVSLKGPLVAWLRREVPEEGLPYGRLLARLEEAFGAEDDASRRKVEAAVTPLLQVGFLVPRPPWPSHEAHLEARLLQHLESLADPRLESIRAPLERLVELERGYGETGTPERTVRQVVRCNDAVWSATAELLGQTSEIERVKPRRGGLYEDVLWVSDHEPWQRIGRMPRHRTEELRETVTPLVRLAGLFSSRHELRHALTGLAHRRWPGRRDVPVLELFSAFQPLWRKFVEGEVDGSEPEPGADVFNPLDMDEVRELATLRSEVWNALPETVEPTDSPEELRWNRVALETLVARIPDRYGSPVGGCPAVQPADARGRRWVLNKLFEGIGRLGSRFTPVMGGELGPRYAGWLAARGSYDESGEPVELLDLASVQGDTLNVHQPQTPRVLELPGQSSGLPPDRRVRLGDLRVRFGDDGQAPGLVDRQGRRLLPVHLGVAAHSFMPALVRFLANLGPRELRPVDPPIPSETRGELTLRPRLVLGNLVVARQRWRVDPASLRAAVETLEEPEAFRVADDWRRSFGLPSRVFWREPRPHPIAKSYTKPQFLDWTSPLFVALLLSAEARDGEAWTFEEMLPPPEAFPVDPQGRPRATEALVDDLALRPVTGRLADVRDPASERLAAATTSKPA